MTKERVTRAEIRATTITQLTASVCVYFEDKDYFTTSLQEAISATCPELPDEQQADLYARIVTGQEKQQFKTAAGFMALVMFELGHTRNLFGESA